MFGDSVLGDQDLDLGILRQALLNFLGYVSQESSEDSRYLGDLHPPIRCSMLHHPVNETHEVFNLGISETALYGRGFM